MATARIKIPVQRLPKAPQPERYHDLKLYGTDYGPALGGTPRTEKRHPQKEYRKYIVEKKKLRKWFPEEEELLRHMHADGESVSEIACALGRDKKTVQCRVAILEWELGNEK